MIIIRWLRTFTVIFIMFSGSHIALSNNHYQNVKYFQKAEKYKMIRSRVVNNFLLYCC